MRFRTKKEEDPTIPIAPLIDVVFLLLIFFTVTSDYHVASGVPIKLPKITQSTYEGETQNINVSIDNAGNIYLKGERIDSEQLGPALQSLLDKEHTAQLILQADMETKHGIVVQVMDIAKSIGISSIVIAAQWDPKR